MTTENKVIIDELIALVADIPSTTSADLEDLILEVETITRNAAEETREAMDNFSQEIERSVSRRKIHFG